LKENEIKDKNIKNLIVEDQINEINDENPNNIEEKEGEETKILEVDFRDCHNYHQEKKKKKNIHKIGIWNYYISNTWRFLFKQRLKTNREIFDKSLEITDYYMDIVNVIRKFMEFDFIKKVLMTEQQRKLMKYQYRYLNLNNPEETIKYLDSFLIKEKLSEDLFDNEDEILDVNMKMVDGFLKYYNY